MLIVSSSAANHSQIYDPDLVVPLCATLRLFLTHTSKSLAGSSETASSGRFVLLAATIRNQETTERFYVECGKSAERSNYRVEDRRVTIEHDH